MQTVLGLNGAALSSFAATKAPFSLPSKLTLFSMRYKHNVHEQYRHICINNKRIAAKFAQ
jgi:hypothetical protein